MRRLTAAAALVVVVAAAACSKDAGSGSGSDGGGAGAGGVVGTATAAPAAVDDGVPRVVGVSVTAAGDETYRFDVTVSSPYDGPDQYADAWRVLGPDGEVLAVRELTHDHAGEQPFTRSLDGVAVPEGVTAVRVEARDLLEGWSGETLEVQLDR